MCAAAFTQVFHGAVDGLAKHLTLQQQGVLWRLTACIDRGDTIIKDNYGIPMTVTEIAKALGVSRQHTSTLLTSLVQAGALTEIATGRGKHFAFTASVAHRYSRRSCKRI